MLKTFSIRSALPLNIIALALCLNIQMVYASPLLSIPDQEFQNVVGFNGNEPISGNLVTTRTYEFYDNQTGNGGGSASTNAITGKILDNSLTFDDSGLINGFTIRATITNDFPPQGTWLDGANSHGETLSTPFSFSNLYNVKLTTEFADDGIKGNFPSSGEPYFGPESNIFAKNYDELAWYSFPTTGAFIVPTWDFGDILLGNSVFRDLQFGLYTSVSQATIQFLIDSSDIFMNRTTDLKIGDYFEKGTGNGLSYEGLAVDNGSAYPNTLNRSGNVSVFAVPEPTSLALMIAGLAGLVSSCRRRKVCLSTCYNRNFNF